MHYNSGFGNFDHGLRESVVAVGPAYTQNIIFIFFIEYRVAVSLAPQKTYPLLIRLESCTTNRSFAQRFCFCGLRIEGSTWILHPSQDFVASGSQDPPGSNTPHRVLWLQDRRIHLDPTPLTGFCGLSIVGSTQIQHPSQGSTASRSQEPPGSCAPHSVLWPQDRRTHQDPAPLTWFCGLRIEGSTWLLHSSQGSVAPESTPFTWFCGHRIARATWILHPSQGSVASGSKDPPGSCTPHRVLGPQDRRIHLDPTPLTRCSSWIHARSYAFHTDLHLDPPPIRTWIHGNLAEVYQLLPFRRTWIEPGLFYYNIII
jgi:hypothetical protein